MTTLPNEFRKSGFYFRLVKRQGDKAIYSKSRAGGVGKHYEVIKIREHDEYVMGGVTIPAGESYPSSEQWGRLGYTYPTLEEAEERFNRIKSTPTEPK